MRESFTHTLQQAIRQAQRDARELKQEFVGTEHLLSAALAPLHSDAQALMQRAHLDSLALRSALLKQLPRGLTDPVVTGDLPLSPKAHRAVNAAMVEAQTQRRSTIGTAQLLRALLDDCGELVERLIERLGSNRDRLRLTLLEVPATPEQ